jgi:integrase
MGSVYKRRNASGKRRTNYVMEFKDQMGKTRIRSTGTSDKRAALRILAEREREVAEIVNGVRDPLQEQYGEAFNRPIEDHLREYLEACEGNQVPQRIKEKESRICWVLAGVGARRLADLRPDKVDSVLRAGQQQGMAARTINLRLEGINAFLNWCVKNGRLQSNPLRVIARRNQVGDRRVRRRALTPEEISSLLSVSREAAKSNPQAKLRPLWYMLPLLAGLRRGDMVNLTWGCVDLEAHCLTIRGGKAKQREDRLPITPELLAELARVRPRNAMPFSKVFPKPVCNETRKKDFIRAGIELKDDAGEVADLHALRTTFATNLALQGVPPAITQVLMRHTSIELTMRYYTRLKMRDLHTRGLDLLPRLEA